MHSESMEVSTVNNALEHPVITHWTLNAYRTLSYVLTVFF